MDEPRRTPFASSAQKRRVRKVWKAKKITFFSPSRSTRGTEMSQKSIRENIQVMVIPRFSQWRTSRGVGVDDIVKDSSDLYAEAERIASEIRRHVDDCGIVQITYNTVKACEFCGDESEWVNEDPSCCQASLDEFLEIGKAYVERMKSAAISGKVGE
jgi:hypothetical protein